MKVEEIMTRNVRSCRPEDSLNEAARIMWEGDCGFVPVVEMDDGPRVRGVLTDRDICMAAYTRGKALADLAVRDTMSSRLRTCSPGDRLQDAEQLMREAQVRRLPVVDEAGRLLGVLSLSDLACEIARERAGGRKGVSGRRIGEALSAICRRRDTGHAKRA